MKFSVIPKRLSDSLVSVSKLVGSVSDVVLTSKDGAIQIFASGSIGTVSIQTEANVKEKGSCIVELTALQGVIKPYKAELTFEAKDDLLYFKSASQKDFKGHLSVRMVSKVPKLKPPKSSVSFSTEAVSLLADIVPKISIVDSKLKQEVAISVVVAKNNIEVGSASFIEAAYSKVKAKVKGEGEFNVPARFFPSIKNITKNKKYGVSLNDSSIYMAIENELTFKMASVQSALSLDQIKEMIDKDSDNGYIEISANDVCEALETHMRLITSTSTYLDMSITKEGLVLHLSSDKGKAKRIVKGIEDTPLKKSKETFTVYPQTIIKAFQRASGDVVKLGFCSSSILTFEIVSEEANTKFIMLGL